MTPSFREISRICALSLTSDIFILFSYLSPLRSWTSSSYRLFIYKTSFCMFLFSKSNNLTESIRDRSSKANYFLFVVILFSSPIAEALCWLMRTSCFLMKARSSSNFSATFANTLRTSLWHVPLMSLHKSIINSICRLHSSTSSSNPEEPLPPIPRYLLSSMSFSMLSSSQ